MEATEKNVTPAAKPENILSVSEEERKEKEGKERMEQLRKKYKEMDGKIYGVAWFPLKSNLLHGGWRQIH